MKAGIQKMDICFRRGTPTRRPGESRGLGERCPLDSGLCRNDEGGRTEAGRRRGMTGKNVFGIVLYIVPFCKDFSLKNEGE